MKTFLSSILPVLLIVSLACQEHEVNKPSVSNVPAGYYQPEAYSPMVQELIREFESADPEGEFYYLALEQTTVIDLTKFWQKQLKVEKLVYGEQLKPESKPLGVIVKRIYDLQDEVFIKVEQNPEPVAGLPAFIEYVSSHIKYPEKARDQGIEGKVFVEFVIDDSGNLIEPRILKGISQECDQEALRVIKTTNLGWHPGTIQGEPVKVKMILPVSFKLS